jgi:hypothetical protein
MDRDPDRKELDMRASCDLMVLALALVGCRTQEPLQPPAEPPLGPGAEVHSAVALDALAQARTALAAWRIELEDGERIDDGALLDLRSATQELGGELSSLWGAVEAREAALRPDPQRSARRLTLTMRAREHADGWVQDIRATGPDADGARAAALDAVREALQSEDEVLQLAGLMTLQRVGEVRYEKAPFRALVLPFAQEATGQVLVAALYALAATDRRPEDLALVHSAWERDREGLEHQTLNLLRTFGDGRLENRSEEIALSLLEHVDGRTVNQQLNGLWGAQVGPALEARVLELARSPEPEVRHGAIYFGLATFEGKSEAVVEALIATLADPDPNNWQRALWGLGVGVPEALQPRVVAALVELHNGRTDPGVRAACARLVAGYGGPEAEARLER